MSLTDGLLNIMGRQARNETQAPPEQPTLRLDSNEGWFPRGHRPMDAQTALKLSAFYRAVDLRSDSVGKFPVRVINKYTREKIDNHPLMPILSERPNEAMSPFTYKKLVEYQRLVLGNAYVWIYRDKLGTVRELLPLPPGTCEPMIEPGTGKLWYIAQEPKSGRTYRLHPEEIEHYKGFSTNGLTGENLLRHAARTLEVASARDDYELAVYKNGGRPSGVLYTDSDLSNRREIEMPDGSKMSLKDKVRAEWERLYAGPDNSFRTAVLDLGLKYEPIAMSNADQQFVENKALSVEDIARFVGVPLHMLYAGKQSYDSNEANSIDYVKYSMMPSVVAYEEEDSYKLLLPSERAAGLRVRRNMMADLRGDSKSRVEFYKGMEELSVYSPNDVAELEDIPDVPGGDVRKASLNYVPLEDWPELSKKRAAGNGKS